MSHNLFVVSAGTTGRCIYSNQIGFPNFRLYNSGAAPVLAIVFRLDAGPRRAAARRCQLPIRVLARERVSSPS